MDEEGFRRFLEGAGYTQKAINSRMTKARRVERDLNICLDGAVRDEQQTLQVRELIYQTFKLKPGNYYNAVTRYFKYRNGRELPTTR